MRGKRSRVPPMASGLDLALTINSSLDLDETLQKTCRAAVEFFSADHCGLVLFDPNHSIGCVRAEHPVMGTLGKVIPLRGVPAEEDLIETPTPLVIFDVASDVSLGAVRDVLLEFDIQSILIVPVVGKGGKPLGSFSLDAVGHRRQFTAEEVELCRGFAALVAVAVENARLFAELSEANEESARRQQLLMALDEASRHIRAEKETPKLLHEVVRLAAQLVGCPVGVLFVNRPHLGELELVVTYGLPTTLIGERLPHPEGLAGAIARAGKPHTIGDYAKWPDREALFEPYHFSVVAGVPLKQVGKVEAVLLVADPTDRHWLTQPDLEVLERFAEQAAIALQTSRSMSREQRMLSQLGILYEISDYIQAAGDLDKILHVVLTGVTAGYGLGFNRAALLLMDDRREYLVGRMGIGHLEESEARQDWAQHHRRGLEDFRGYLELLEQNGLPLTPVGIRIREVQVPIPSGACDLFLQVMRERRCMLITQGTSARLPESFVKSFEPAPPLVVVPLMARGQAIGVLVADNKFTQSPITPEDEESLLTFANTAAVAIDNAQLRYDSARRIKELEHMHQAAEALAGAASLQEVLEEIVQGAREVLEANSAAIWSYDDVRDRFIPESSVSSGIPTSLWQEFREEESRPGRTAYTIIERGWVDVTDVTDTERYGFLGDSTRGLLGQIGVRSFQGIALVVESETLGVLYVNYNGPRSFHEGEQEIARTFAYHATLALNKARLLDQVSRAQSAAKLVAQVTVLGDREATLSSVARGTQEVTGCDAVTLFVYNQATDKLEHPPAMVGVRYPDRASLHGEVLSNSLVYEMLRRDEPYIVEAMAQDALFRDRRFSREEEIQCCVAIPLWAVGQKVGVMFVNYRTPHRFTAKELANIEPFANQAAVAIRNAQLYEESKQTYERLKQIKGFVGTKTAVDWIRMVSTSWGHGIRREVGTALGHVALLCELLAKVDVGPEAEKEVEELEQVIKGIREIPITAPLSYEDAVDSVRINELVKTHLERQWTHARYRPVKLHLDLQENLDSRVTVRASREWLRRVLEILIDNSVQAMLEADSPEQRLIVTTRLLEEQVELSVKDTGPGIPNSIWGRLFKEPIDKPVGSKGAGIGLVLAQTIVQTYGGDIRAEQPADGGTDVVITLPVEGKVSK